MKALRESPRALTFDVFGSVVDWRTSIAEEAAAVGRSKGIEADWEAFADAWRQGYGPAMNRVREGRVPWTVLDDLHRSILESLLDDYGLGGLSEREKDELNRAWHRLRPWPDAIPGLARLRSKYLVATLSNGNMALLTNLSRNAGLTWDCILSAELARHYKPDPEVYRTAARMLALDPGEIMMVASHEFDLAGAQAVGFRTAFVRRSELVDSVGAGHGGTDSTFDIEVTDFLELADALQA